MLVFNIKKKMLRIVAHKKHLQLKGIVSNFP